jgi:hypothetical protein
MNKGIVIGELFFCLLLIPLSYKPGEKPAVVADNNSKPIENIQPAPIQSVPIQPAPIQPAPIQYQTTQPAPIQYQQNPYQNNQYQQNPFHPSPYQQNPYQPNQVY